MFIVSKRNYAVRRADGSLYEIKKDYIGEIPDDVASSGLVRRAVRAGRIFSPQGTKDRQLEMADREAEEKAKEGDIRPDADKKAAQEPGSGEDSGKPPSEKKGSRKQG